MKFAKILAISVLLLFIAGYTATWFYFAKIAKVMVTQSLAGVVSGATHTNIETSQSGFPFKIRINGFFRKHIAFPTACR